MAKKKFIHLFPNYTNWQTVVTIDWQPFESYNQFLQKSEEDQSDGYFYKIVGKRGNLYRLLYIGMTYKQTPTKRLKQHEKKINQLKEQNKDYAIQVIHETE